MNALKYICLLAVALLPGVQAKMDLVTVPERDKVQLTIYNSADLTLVREQRALTLSEGINRLQFSWANTLIDPTSLSLTPKAQGDKIEVFDLSFPPRVRELGLWNIQSAFAGRVPVEIDYLTSGLSWRAFYMATLTKDESHMRLQGYVRVTNNSGEDYDHAQTRLIVGKVHMLDEIAALAKRQHPYGSPLQQPRPQSGMTGKGAKGLRRQLGVEFYSGMLAKSDKRKEIKKEGLSEYFLYTIEGEESISHGWSKRLPSFDVAEIPVVNLYKYEEERYGASVVRFLSFKNDEDHKLGETPIPGGSMKVFRGIDDAQHLSYEGQSSFKYIPVKEDVELNMGAVGNVTVVPQLMDYQTGQYVFNGHGDVTGWHEIRTWKLEIKNTRPLAVKVEIQRNFPTQYWSLERKNERGTYEKVDLDTVKYTLELEAMSQESIQYKLTTRHGTRETKGMKTLQRIILLGTALTLSAVAKMDLVTVPERDKVQLTIYNSADLTLVREQRALTLSEGINRLQFSWANTLIDPTSLSMTPKVQGDRIKVFDLTFPPRVRELGLWNIQSTFAGRVPVEIDYLTSGLSWRAFYVGTLTEDESHMRLQGYVRVSNNSGEDYANAHTRLIVGKVHLLDEIATLAKRPQPFGSPINPVNPKDFKKKGEVTRELLEGQVTRDYGMIVDELGKSIKKEGLSEYFLYTIEGEESIPHGWSKRLPSFDVGEIPVLNLYKYEEERYGAGVVRFLSFKNDEDHKLGETPIPGGSMKVFRNLDEAQHLSYEGQSSFKYIPVNEDVELNLGAVGNVTVEPHLMDQKTLEYRFNGDGNITGWDEQQTWKITVKNTRPVKVKTEVQRNFGMPHWTLERKDEVGSYEKVDVDTVKYTLELAPRSKQSFSYVLTKRHGLRQTQP